MKNELITDREVFEAFAYECNYKDFSKDIYSNGKPVYNWSEALWSLISAKNTYTNSVLKLDVFIRGKDENGFYQNYIYLLVKENSVIRWDEYLKSLGYGYSKRRIKVCRYIIEWDEQFDEYLLEVE